MQPEPLNIDPDALSHFDSAPVPDDDLSAFEEAAGVTVLPPGEYLCVLERGELKTTKTNKQAYRLCFSVVEPAKYAKFPLWRYYLLDRDNANRSKAALAPLGIKTAADVRRCPFPEPGRTITCRVLVTLQRNDPTRNDVERFTVERDERGDGTFQRFALEPQS